MGYHATGCRLSATRWQAFDERDVDSVAQCEAMCSDEPTCKGIFYYNRSRRCKGLTNVGGDGTKTGIDADSYTKVRR